MGLGLYEQADTYKMSTINFQIKQLGSENADKIIYYLEAGADISGLCAVLRRTISGLYIADMLNAVPVVSWNNAPLLNDYKIINGSGNPFEYFFEPLSNVSVEEAQNSMNVIEHVIRNDAYVWGEGRISAVDGQSEQYIKLQQEVLKKHPLILKKCVEERLQEDIRKLAGNCAMLGVHVRGAQRRRRIRGLANPIPIDWYYSEIDNVLKNNQYDKIFLATDDDEYLENFKNRYGDKVLYYADTERCKEGVIPYFSTNSPKYRVTYETLRDMYTLMHCNTLIGGPSNVTILVRVLKMYYGEWDHCIMLDNGVCEDGEANKENTLKIIQNNGSMDVLERNA